MPDISKEIKILNKIIKKGLKNNTYNKRHNKTEYHMWNEQCKINFPILYLSSIYLYEYGRRRNCSNFLFATRDCCQWYKVFKQMYPDVQSTYFHCSRNMFERATENDIEPYNQYVKNIVKNEVSKTVFIDIHGTGKRMFAYFEKIYNEVPYCFLLSATFDSFDDFPSISKHYYKKDKIINLVFNTRGSPIEMLNYDNIGTLQTYTENGPVRDNLEYSLDLIKPYHDGIHYLIKHIKPMSNIDCDSKINKIKKEILKVFDYLKDKELILAEFIKHIGKHKKKEIVVENHKKEIVKKEIIVENDGVFFDKIISDDTVYAIVWEGRYNNLPCVIKMVKLDTGVCNSSSDIFTYSNEDPYRHKDFKNKKEMSHDQFMYEVNQLKSLYKYKLTPKVFKNYICKKYDVHYGFIVMEKYDCSLKHVIQKRPITHEEEKIIYKMIGKMHKCGFVHGDMKPSNIGINFDNSDKIMECCLLDSSKAKNKKSYESKKFKSLIKIDWDTYFNHKQKNMFNN